MANIWLDRENVVNMPLHSAKKEGGLRHFTNTNSALKQSNKKNVLGNLNNLIHNKTATPFRGGVVPLKPDVFQSSSKSLCQDVLRKEQRKINFREAQTNVEQKLKPMQAAIITPSHVRTNSAQKNIELLDVFDFPYMHCHKDCKKSLPEIWSDEKTISEETVKQLVNSFPETPDIDELESKWKEMENIKCLDIDKDECDKDDAVDDCKDFVNIFLNLNNLSNDQNDDYFKAHDISLPNFDELNLDLDF